MQTWKECGSLRHRKATCSTPRRWYSPMRTGWLKQVVGGQRRHENLGTLSLPSDWGHGTSRQCRECTVYYGGVDIWANFNRLKKSICNKWTSLTSLCLLENGRKSFVKFFLFDYWCNELRSTTCLHFFKFNACGWGKVLLTQRRRRFPHKVASMFGFTLFGECPILRNNYK